MQHIEQILDGYKDRSGDPYAEPLADAPNDGEVYRRSLLPRQRAAVPTGGRAE